MYNNTSQREIFMRKYGLPLVFIVSIALITKLFTSFQDDAVGHFFYLMIQTSLLFSLGLSLNTHKKSRHQAWFKKVVVSLVVLFFLLYQLDLIIVMKEMHLFFNFIGLNTFVIELIYIYCGWIFFS